LKYYIPSTDPNGISIPSGPMMIIDNIIILWEFKPIEDDCSIKSTLPGREERTSREG